MNGHEHRRALAIVAGCPDGITGPALLELNGVAIQTVYWLEERKLIEVRVEQVAARNSSMAAIPVPRVRITDRGREYLERTR